MGYSYSTGLVWYFLFPFLPNRCAVNWPPLIVEGKPTAGEGVNADLLGTVERTDGTMQATYNGWPLYY